MSCLIVDEKLNSWQEISGNWPFILLGNGFSINIWSGFSYNSLYDKACELKVLNKCSQNIFKKTNDFNFEKILRILYYSKMTSDVFGQEKAQTLAENAYKNVQEALISAVSTSHLSRGKDGLSGVLKDIGDCLLEYKKIFTTNYDLILYWALSEREFIGFKDLFWGKGGSLPISDLSVYDNSNIVYYLHGALHLVVDSNGVCKKLYYAAVNNAEDIYKSSGEDGFPLFISEGKSKHKFLKIKSNNYLGHIYDEFSRLEDSLLVLGHSLSEEVDGHIIEAIKNNASLKRLAVGIYPNQAEEEIIEFKARTHRQLGKEKSIVFFDSATHPLTSPTLNLDEL